MLTLYLSPRSRHQLGSVQLHARLSMCQLLRWEVLIQAVTSDELNFLVYRYLMESGERAHWQLNNSERFTNSTPWRENMHNWPCLIAD